MFTAFSFEKGVLQIFPVSVEPHFSCMGEVIMWRMRSSVDEVEDIIDKYVCVLNV